MGTKCEYCQGIVENVGKTNSWTTIYFDLQHKLIGATSYEDDTKVVVKYCPMCGRKLEAKL